ncbi:hypothetical protein TKK_0006756 [Trichogramma kaykai]
MVSLCYRNLVTFIGEDNLSGLQHFLENKRTQVDDRDENGVTALIFAATKGKLQFVRHLIDHGADVNAEDADNWTALLCAAKEGHTDVCMELIEHGAKLEHRDVGGWTALMWAAYKNHGSTVTLLLSRGADVNAHGNYHISSLLWAAGRGYADIVKQLLSYGAKVNVGDKYGTTALVWAARNGNEQIVSDLLDAGANADTAGMYSWTPLIVATQNNHATVVNKLLSIPYRPNVNAVDKDGCTALSIACREGYSEIVTLLLNAGAYVNIQDKSGDTNLIHAVKGGYKVIVDALLKKHVEINIPGKDRKTATYVAVEKVNPTILKMLLHSSPDLEIATKDGDTPLLRAVKLRNEEMVLDLLKHRAKVSATDNKGDTVLHIAMRARSRRMVEILLQNPKHSQLLYRPNKAGETPYNIDLAHNKNILSLIFGARRLNTNEDNENMLGYDLYSCALADILSEPSLSTPITVGLYAKWGSGKSFLLNKLREEMKNFARHWLDPTFEFSTLLFLVILHISLIFGVILGLFTQSWIAGLASGVGLVVLTYLLLSCAYYANNKYDWDWPYNFTTGMSKKLNSLKLLLQVTFCHPPGPPPTPESEVTTVQPIKFFFTDQTRVGTTAAGENAIVQMVGSLYDAIEAEFGSLPTRLYRALKPKATKTNESWKWRQMCCMPNVAIFEFCFISFLLGISVLAVYLFELSSEQPVLDRVTAHIIMICIAVFISVNVIAHMRTWGKTIRSLIFSQRRQLRRRVAKLENLKSEGFIQTLKSEVNLMVEMVKCLDSFTSQKSRLVVVVDGLDSCEQDKVLLVLDAIQALFSDNGCPFVVILAIDPHIISKAVEVNSRRLFTESNIGGHDYLRNMVHLPFYLQNSGLRQLKVAQNTARENNRKAMWSEAEESANYAANPIQRSMSNRRLSTESTVINSNEKLKPPSRKGSRKLRMSDSIASSIGSNLNKMGGAQDLSKMLLTDDYFSDVNPRSMRRLMNVVYITGRLLKSFQIDFNWYHLASWINITEQWPFRTSWIILHYDTTEDNLEDSMSLKNLYDKVRPQIPILKDAQLDMDRDERKLDAFLTFHRSRLLVSDMKVFLPFTINLDPYIKKKIKEEQQTMEEEASQQQQHQQNMFNWANPVVPSITIEPNWSMQRGAPANRSVKQSRTTVTQQIPSAPLPMHMQGPPMQMPPQSVGWSTAGYGYEWRPQWHPTQNLMSMMDPKPVPAVVLPPEIMDQKLSTLTVDNICDLLDKIQDINPQNLPTYKRVIKDNNITGAVLLNCDISDLKEVLHMAFGDWELFRIVIVSLREQERTTFTTTNEEGPRSVRFIVGADEPNAKKVDHATQNNSVRVPSIVEKEKGTSRTDGPPRRDSTKQSIMEKQVTLEEQMICGALQTLNEEACEDVLDVPPAPVDSLPGMRSRASSMSHQETDYVILQSNPLLHWVPVSEEALAEDSSSDDSMDSYAMPQMHRASSQRSLSSHCSVVSSCSTNNHYRTPPTSAGLHHKQQLRPGSLMVSPPTSPKPASRSKSTDNYAEALRRGNRRSTTSLSEELGITIPVPPVTSGLPAKLSRLKDKLLSHGKSGQQQTGSNDATLSTSEDSGGESTPLVSELSSPTCSSDTTSSMRSPGPTDNSSDSISPTTAGCSNGGHMSRDLTSSLEHCVLDMGALGLMVHESTASSANGGRSLARQNAEDWENPETPV